MKAHSAEKIIRNLFFQVPLIQRKMQLYLANRETEFILFRWPTGVFFFILMKADCKCRHCYWLLCYFQAYSVQLDEHVSGASLHAEERVLHWPADSGRLSISGLIDDYKRSTNFPQRGYGSRLAITRYLIFYFSSVADPESLSRIPDRIFSIPDLGSDFFPYRIRLKQFRYFNLKT